MNFRIFHRSIFFFVIFYAIEQVPPTLCFMTQICWSEIYLLIQFPLSQTPSCGVTIEEYFRPLRVCERFSWRNSETATAASSWFIGSWSSTYGCQGAELHYMKDLGKSEGWSTSKWCERYFTFVFRPGLFTVMRCRLQMLCNAVLSLVYQFGVDMSGFMGGSDRSNITRISFFVAG